MCHATIVWQFRFSLSDQRAENRTEPTRNIQFSRQSVHLNQTIFEPKNTTKSNGECNTLFGLFFAAKNEIDETTYRTIGVDAISIDGVAIHAIQLPAENSGPKQDNWRRLAVPAGLPHQQLAIVYSITHFPLATITARHAPCARSYVVRSMLTWLV